MSSRYRAGHHPVMRFWVCLAVVFVLLPLVLVVLWSLNSLWTFPDVMPDSWTLRGFESMLFGSKDFVEIVGTSLLVTSAVCLLSALIATLTAQALVFYEFPGKSLVDFLVYLPCIVPAVVLGIGTHILFIKLGLSNSLVGVILIQTMISMPYAIKIVTNATRLLGRRFTEQAIVLGSSPARAYFQVSFHLLVPSLISAMCMAFTASFSDYFLTFLVGGGRVQTFAIAVVPLISGADTNMAAAYSVAYTVLAFLFFLALEWLARRITRKQDLYLM